MGVALYEYRRAKTLRTTWITSAALVLGIPAVALLATSTREELPDPTATILGSALNPFALLLIASLAAMAFGHEYRFETIRPALIAFPNRTRVFIAKLVYSVTVAVVAMILAVLLSTVVLRIRGITSGYDHGKLLSQTALYALTVAVIAFALTVITRNHPVGIVGPLMLNIGITLVIAFTQWQWVRDIDPFGGYQQLLAGNAVAIGSWLAWIVVPLGIAFLILHRRDA